MDEQGTSAAFGEQRAERSHYPALDGLRGLAVIAVLIAHLPSAAAGRIHSALPQLMHMSGYWGVDQFFVLSGFLITRILLSDRINGTPLRFFLIRRCLRIFPIYYATIALFAVLAPSMALVWCALYLSNYYFVFNSDWHLLRHTWSLCIEEHFYVVWPLVVYRLSPRASRKALFLLMGLSLSFSSLLVIARVPQAASLIYQSTPSRVWSLGIGALLAYASGGLFRFPTVRPAPYALCGFIFCAAAVFAARSGRGALAYLAMVPGYSLISFALVLAVVVGDKLPALFSRLLGSRPLRLTGKISYGLYLYHPIVYGALLHGHDAQPSGNLLLRCVLAIVAAFGLSAASYRYFESYFLRLKEKFVVQAGAPTADQLSSH